MSVNNDMNPEIHRAIQSAIQDDNTTDGAFVVGWVLLVETANPDGSRSLSRMDRGADGDRLTRWQRGGYLHDGLYGAFPEPRHGG
jgi:hypothetical protein